MNLAPLWNKRFFSGPEPLDETALFTAAPETLRHLRHPRAVMSVRRPNWRPRRWRRPNGAALLNGTSLAPGAPRESRAGSERARAPCLFRRARRQLGLEPANGSPQPGWRSPPRDLQARSNGIAGQRCPGHLAPAHLDIHGR